MRRAGSYLIAFSLWFQHLFLLNLLLLLDFGFRCFRSLFLLLRLFFSFFIRSDSEITISSCTMAVELASLLAVVMFLKEVCQVSTANEEFFKNHGSSNANPTLKK